MRRHLTIPQLLRFLCYCQLTALWVYGLCHWLVGTLALSTGYLALQLAWHDYQAQQAELEARREKRS